MRRGSRRARSRGAPGSSAAADRRPSRAASSGSTARTASRPHEDPAESAIQTPSTWPSPTSAPASRRPARRVGHGRARAVSAPAERCAGASSWASVARRMWRRVRIVSRIGVAVSVGPEASRRVLPTATRADRGVWRGVVSGAASLPLVGGAVGAEPSARPHVGLAEFAWLRRAARRTDRRSPNPSGRGRRRGRGQRAARVELAEPADGLGALCVHGGQPHLRARPRRAPRACRDRSRSCAACAGRR